MPGAAALAALILSGCAHHLRMENTRTQEVPSGAELIEDSGDLVVTLAVTREELVVTLERDVFVEQDVDVQSVADEILLPWSGRAVTQFLFVSWNPILWCFPDVWREPEGRDHPAICDWLLLWNPFIRTGAHEEETRREVVLRHQIERRRLGAHRLPLNQTEVGLEIEGGGARESIIRTTDNHGQVRLAFDILPPVMRRARPITVVGRVAGRGEERAQLF